MHIQKQALHAKNLKKITDIGLHNYGGDAGNTLQYVLKSFTDAQQQRQHGEKQAFNKDKQWNGNEAMHIKQPCTRKIWKKITVIVLHKYGGDVGNTLHYVLKSFTNAQQMRHNDQEREQTVER